MKKPQSLHGRVRAFVLSRTRSTSKDIIAAIGRHVTSAQAAKAGKRQLNWFAKRHNYKNTIRPTEYLIRSGREKAIREAIFRLVQCGHIRRIEPGIYGPPERNGHD